MTEIVLIANAGDGTISTLRLHRGDRPRLEVLATTGGLEGCGSFAVDRERDLVYAAYKGEHAGIATLSLDRESGELAERSRTEVEDSMTYLELSHGGTLLLGASYGGGVGLVWPVQEGVVGEPTARTENANLHCVIARAGHAWFVSLGDDLVSQHALSPDGALRPLDPPTLAMPEGSGPRHLILNGDGNNAYLVTEFSGEVFRLTVQSDGTLQPHEAVHFVDPSQGLSHSRMDADPLEEHLIWGADVGIAGDLVLASERTSSLITSVPLQDGRLGEPVGFTPVPTQPRGFRVSDDGRYVVSVGERATEAVLLDVGQDGTLTQVDVAEIGNGANWVRFV
ncbi:lactonase family protein [Ornithinimicrobium pratense]|uniref:Lactonase family protein n=1 Tax=Ornithinimicrobium pratense TaxID=2593973 RepID=A0A5J6V6M5_9MICO|nr:beta-propeller fold lactonase family protein [Ornithinimicrobium pratense]QFG68693.1 lactonase family protein [Ornithinimicrobium pratense]